MIFDFLKPEWKKEVDKGHIDKAFKLFKKRHPALVAHCRALPEFERRTGIVMKRRAKKEDPLWGKEANDFLMGENPDLGSPEDFDAKDFMPE